MVLEAAKTIVAVVVVVVVVVLSVHRSERNPCRGLAAPLSS